MTAAASDLATIGSTLSAAHAAAAPSTGTLLPAAADEISATIAQVFSEYAQDYQGLASRAAGLHQQFVDNLMASAGAYGTTEAAGAAALRPAHEVASALPSAAAIPNPLSEFFAVLNQLINFLRDPVGFIIRPIIATAVSTVIALFLRLLAGVIFSSVTFSVPT